MIKDYILIIGAMKSGTTTLFAQLSADPRIAGAHPKEPGFFAFEEVRSLGWDWYEGLFQFDAGAHRYALDASTDYSKRPFVEGVPERLRGAEAEGRRFKLIYIMRHPVERLLSHAQHVSVRGREVGRSQSPRRQHDLDAGLSPVNLALSDYAAQLEAYRSWLERGDLHLLTLESLTAHKSQEMARLSAFLELPDLAFRNEAAKVNRASDKRREHPMVKALQDTPIGAAARAVLPASAVRSLKNTMKQPVQAEGRFTMSDEERRRFGALFASQCEKLRDRFGFDPEWTFE